MSEILFDNSFEADKTQEYLLSIQISLDGFSFSVINPNENRLLAYKAVLLKISHNNFLARRFKEWVHSEKLFQKEFKSINVIFDTEEFTIIPEKFYEYNSKSEIINHLFELTGETIIEVITLEEQNAKLLFSVPAELKEEIAVYFEKFNLIHPVKTLFENLPVNNKKFRQILLYNKHYFYALLLEDTKLLLSNSFRVKHENDSIFYVLSLLKQMKVAKSAVNLFVSGKVTTDSKLFSELQKYIPSIQILKHKQPLHINENMFREPEKIDFSLLS